MLSGAPNTATGCNHGHFFSYRESYAKLWQHYRSGSVCRVEAIAIPADAVGRMPNINREPNLKEKSNRNCADLILLRHASCATRRLRTGDVARFESQRCLVKGGLDDCGCAVAMFGDDYLGIGASLLFLVNRPMQ
jgi:hypothetical protein